MKQKIKNTSATLLAFLLLLIVGIISMSGIVPIEQQQNFENISNIMMFIVAVIVFFFQMQSRCQVLGRTGLQLLVT